MPTLSIGSRFVPVVARLRAQHSKTFQKVSDGVLALERVEFDTFEDRMRGAVQQPRLYGGVLMIGIADLFTLDAKGQSVHGRPGGLDSRFMTVIAGIVDGAERLAQKDASLRSLQLTAIAVVNPELTEFLASTGFHGEGMMQRLEVPFV